MFYEHRLYVFLKKDNLHCVVYKDLFVSYNLEVILESRKDDLSGPGWLYVNLKSSEVYVSSEWSGLVDKQQYWLHSINSIFQLKG